MFPAPTFSVPADALANTAGSRPRPASAPRRWPLLPLLALLVAAPFSSHALFKVVGPDGKISYSDRPVPESRSGNTQAQPLPQAQTAQATAPGGSTASLPLALRQAAERFPVVLYTTSGCDACAPSRDFLRQRGIPFTERTVQSNEDIAALQRLTGSREAPTVSIGTQVLRGFAPSSWGEYLDVAGYPKTSVLPASYRPPAVSPLVAPSAATPVAPADTTPRNNGSTPQATPSGTGGIRF